MTEPFDLPPQIEQYADPSRNAIILAMIEDEKASVIDTRVEQQREWPTVETVAGDVFEIVRPAISEEVEVVLMRETRAIVADEDDDGS